MGDRGEEERREPGAALFRVMVEQTREYAIFGLDRDGIIATWNAGAERILGFTAEDAVGQPGAISSPRRTGPSASPSWST